MFIRTRQAVIFSINEVFGIATISFQRYKLYFMILIHKKNRNEFSFKIISPCAIECEFSNNEKCFYRYKNTLKNKKNPRNF